MKLRQLLQAARIVVWIVGAALLALKVAPSWARAPRSLWWSR